MFDLVVSLFGLVFLFPLLLGIAALVRLLVERPVLFTQTRPGRHGKPFQIVKFKTMTSNRDREGNLLADEERMTRFGTWLRSSSLDELPELWNVLRGDMSLVGPRPLIMEYLPRYSKQQFRRHEVRQGITGWAQVNGRNAISWDEKFRLDVWYVDNQSLALDLKILCLTLLKVASREGVSADGHATMPFFEGSQDTEEKTGIES